YLFAQAKSAMVTLLDLLPIAAVKPPPSAEDVGGRKQGAVAAHEFFRDIQIKTDRPPRVKQTRRDPALLIPKIDWRELAEHARPYGKSGERLRREAELAPLVRKLRQGKERLTPSEQKKYRQLMMRLAVHDPNYGRSDN